MRSVDAARPQASAEGRAILVAAQTEAGRVRRHQQHEVVVVAVRDQVGIPAVP